jgi:hypothetical protein
MSEEIYIAKESTSQEIKSLLAPDSLNYNMLAKCINVPVNTPDGSIILDVEGQGVIHSLSIGYGCMQIIVDDVPILPAYDTRYYQNNYAIIYTDKSMVGMDVNGITVVLGNTDNRTFTYSPTYGNVRIFKGKSSDLSSSFANIFLLDKPIVFNKNFKLIQKYVNSGMSPVITVFGGVK